MTTMFNYGECCYAECRDLLIIVLNVFILSVAMLYVIMLSVMAPYKLVLVCGQG